MMPFLVKVRATVGVLVAFVSGTSVWFYSVELNHNNETVPFAVTFMSIELSIQRGPGFILMVRHCLKCLMCQLEEEYRTVECWS